VSKERLMLMSEALAHRGPDDTGALIEDTVGLAHRRLSIIDLCGGHQPMTSADGTLSIVFNGEIYNYRQLRAGLSTHHFLTSSDTEVILHLYEELGTECVKQLRGMFAFAIWDRRNRRLFMARDHLGQKPLFYSQTGESIAFASEIKALLAAEPDLRELDPQALHQYLSLRIIAPPRTMYASIKKLPPGHSLCFENGRLSIERYFSLSYEPKLRLKESELIEELEARMLEAVSYHLVSDVPVGAFLSGGMDSSLVVGMMAKVSGQPFKTFSVGVPYRGTSELPYARAVAARYNTQHIEQDIFPSIVRVLPQLVWHLDEPSDPLSACMYYISEMASQHVKVVLGGDGGDELFGGYDRYLGSRYIDYYALLPASLRKHILEVLIKHVPDGFSYKSLSQRLRWLNQLSFVAKERRYARSLGHFYFTEGYREALYGDTLNGALAGFDPEEAISAYFGATNAHELVDRMLYADSMIRLPDHSVMILDRTSMAHGLEARSPLMDHELVEYVAKIPSALKVKGRSLRYIQRRIAERYVPPQVLNRNKQGFSSGLPYLLAKEYHQLFEAFLYDSHLVRDGYLKEQPIRVLLGEHLGKQVDHGNRLWLLCNAEVWYRMAIGGWSKDQVEEYVSGVPA
jgi:asparagine synthase (glutamine-hydrolysing)